MLIQFPCSIVELKSLGVESVAKADLDDVQSLTEAFKGCYGVYGVTGMCSIIPDRTDGQYFNYPC